MSENRATLVVTVGVAPRRKGVWLGVQEGGTWRALAKFRNEEAADEFLRLMARKGVDK